jgi:hypothetical protein
MLYMVIEHYPSGPEPVYRRAAKRGRMLPAGLTYVDSWVTGDDRCFQLMETENRHLFEPWVAAWADLCDFEIVPVVTSAEAAARSVRGQVPAGPDR